MAVHALNRDGRLIPYVTWLVLDCSTPKQLFIDSKGNSIYHYHVKVDNGYWFSREREGFKFESNVFKLSERQRPPL